MEVPFVFAGLLVLCMLCVLAMVVMKRQRMGAPPSLEYGHDRISSPPEGEMRDGRLCRYCDTKAAFRAPRIVAERPWFDIVLRKLGVVAAVRFTLQLQDRDLDAPVVHCSLHHERARALCGIEIGQAQASYAEWLDGRVVRILNFHARGMETTIGSVIADRPDVSLKKSDSIKSREDWLHIARASNGS